MVKIISLFVESDVRARAQVELKKSSKTSGQLLIEAASAFNRFKKYDIFLSHSVRDSNLIFGMKGILEDLNYSVYVDWIDDPQLDRQNISKKTAIRLRERMYSSKSLFFVTTENAKNSKWMPWECGYFDGIKEKVAIVPVKKTSSNNEYNGQEYLGLYPYVIKQKSTTKNERLWIFLRQNIYVSYNYWVKKPNNEIKWKKGR